MKWVTREGARVDRIACPWLIRKFVDPTAEFLFVPRDDVATTVAQTGAIPFDVEGAELSDRDGFCTFEAILNKHGLHRDPALSLLARIVNGADTDNSMYGQAESEGLRAIAEGFRYMGFKGDSEIMRHEFVVYDALYAYCQQQALRDTAARGTGYRR